MRFFDRLFRRTSGKIIETTAQNPYVIEAPSIAFVNLLGSEADALVDEDRTAFASIFAKSRVSDRAMPLCDVLILYCRIEPGGKIEGAQSSLREIIRDSHAKVVVVATENPVKTYIASGKQIGYGAANLVMTLERNGKSFPRFFAQLFAKMAAGMTMPLAWVQLAPQAPGAPKFEVPSTVFACEAGHISFRPGLTGVRRTRPRPSCIVRPVMRPGRAAELDVRRFG